MKKKLIFNKEIIASLSNNELQNVQGGASVYPLLCSNVSLCYCPKTIEVCIDPDPITEVKRINIIKS